MKTKFRNKKTRCEWRNVVKGVWTPGCNGPSELFNDMSPIDFGYSYCPFCGNDIEEVVGVDDET